MPIMRLVFILTFGLTINSWGQTKDKDCTCPPNQYADSKPQTVFKLTSGKSIALCGYSDKETVYSEFVLAVCGQDKIIDFWDAMTYCKISTDKDILVIEELKNLPTGDNLEFKQTIWTSEKMYFKNEQIQRNKIVNKTIRKYTKQEIEKVLKENSKGKINEDKMSTANRLFIAILSGDKKARQYFTDFKTKFGQLDGEFLETYQELTAMLKAWDEA